MNAGGAVAANYRRVLDQIHNAAARSGRKAESIRLVAVTKTVPAERIREAIDCGILDIGESRLQEGFSKQNELANVPVRWHFIGRIQSNKARKIAETFHWVHSVDRIDIAEKLDAGARNRLPVLIEVKLGGEAAKGGVEPSEVGPLAAAIRGCERLDLRGLMTVPPPSENPEGARPYFRRLRTLSEEHGLPELSMGMSHDFEIAIEEGATIVRVGSALFGPRP